MVVPTQPGKHKARADRWSDKPRSLGDTAHPDNEEYTERASYGQEFATVEPLLEPGRSINMDVRYNF